MKRPMSKEDEIEYKKINLYFRYAALLSLIAIMGGTIFYHFIEKWTILDSIYFCVVTLSTVGYGDITPKTALGKIFTIFYILAGIGIIAATVNLLVRRAAVKRGVGHNNLNPPRGS